MANVSAYGYADLEYLFDQRIADVTIPVIQDAVRQSYEQHNRIIADMMSELLSPTTEHQIRFQLADAGELQPLDEHGVPRPRRPTGTYDVAFPIKGGGDAWGGNRVSNAHMTVEDTYHFTVNAMTADLRWLRRHILAAIYTNTTYVYPDKQYGNLTVQPLANGDAVTYTKVNGDVATAQHYIAQAAAIADATNPYPNLYALLSAYPSNMGPYVAYIPTNLVATTIALAEFNPARDTDIIYGADLTTASAVITTDNPTMNSALVGWGNRYLGKTDSGMHVVEAKFLPDSYIIGVARGASVPPLGMREYEPMELRGLFPEFYTPNGNHMESRYIRYAGFGAMNRVAAAVCRVGNGTYAIPTEYSASLLG